MPEKMDNPMPGWVDNSGVQVNYAMINPPNLVTDVPAVQESRIFPYANAQECRETLMKEYIRLMRSEDKNEKI